MVSTNEIYQDVWVTFHAEEHSDRAHVLEIITSWGLGQLGSKNQTSHPQRYVFRIYMRSIHDLQYIKENLHSAGVYLLELEGENGIFWQNPKYDGQNFLPGHLTVRERKALEKTLRKKGRIKPVK